jgi:hypothetical protein
MILNKIYSLCFSLHSVKTLRYIITRILLDFQACWWSHQNDFTKITRYTERCRPFYYLTFKNKCFKLIFICIYKWSFHVSLILLNILISNNHSSIMAFNMACNVVLNGIKCILTWFFLKFEKFLRKKTRRILDPPSKLVKKLPPPRNPPLPQHVLLTGP